MKISSQFVLSSKLTRFVFVTAVALGAAGAVAHNDAKAGSAESIAGTQKVYGSIPPDQIEGIATPDRIKSAAAGRSMMAIWETLEHGERVECLDCIPAVGDLLYDANPRTREIAAWWLRRRVFGVFGEGQVYQQTLNRLATDPDPVSRAYAAEALGEFLAEPGVAAVSQAIEKDADARVRAAAAKALGRLNDDGKGALSRALADGDSSVRLAALRSAGRINTFADAKAVAGAANDPNATVRRNVAETLGAMRGKAAESYETLVVLAKDGDPNVRNSAAHALGALHDARARGVLEELAAGDPDRLVRDQAQIALRRL